MGRGPALAERSTRVPVTVDGTRRNRAGLYGPSVAWSKGVDDQGECAASATHSRLETARRGGPIRPFSSGQMPMNAVLGHMGFNGAHLCIGGRSDAQCLDLAALDAVYRILKEG